MVSTAARVPSNTSTQVNLQIRKATEERIEYYSQHIGEIEARLTELDREWDIERTIEANASTIAFAGIILGTTVNIRWLILPFAVTGFLFQHAIQGWCPPVPVLRNMGFRTADEINKERYALKALRGDFKRVVSGKNKVRSIIKSVGLSQRTSKKG